MKCYAWMVVVAVAYMTGSTDARADGAPDDACASMFPAGHGVAAQTSLSPYKVIVDGSDYSYGEMMMITVTGKNDERLKGVLCQVRKASDPSVSVGTFELMSGEMDLKTKACNWVEDSAVTHQNNDYKMMAQFYWLPPMGDMGDVKVMCTIVETFGTFWTQVLSSQLFYKQPQGEGSATPEGPNPTNPGDGSGMPPVSEDPPMPDYGNAAPALTTGWSLTLLLTSTMLVMLKQLY